MSDIFKQEDMSLLQNKPLKKDLPKSKRFMFKSQWSQKEDRLLERLVREYGCKSWSFIATKLGGRIGKQCRERWYNHLRPNIKTDPWSKEEDITLVQAHKQFGNRWVEIAKRIPGRTENSIKNHYNANQRKHASKCKNKRRRAGGQPDSVLQEYISMRMRMSMNDGNGKVKKGRKENYNCNKSIESEKEESKVIDENKPYIPLPVNEDLHGMQMDMASEPNSSKYEGMDLSTLLSGSDSSTVPLNVFYSDLKNPNLDSGIHGFHDEFDFVKNEMDFVEMIFPKRV